MRSTSFWCRHENRRTVFPLLASVLFLSCCDSAKGFSTLQPHTLTALRKPLLSPSTTALRVWWFGGAESSEVSQDDDSCELVAVRIDRTSPNSRRIAGSITVPTRMTDVWAILTDYDRLSIHVPNLVESKILSKPRKGEQGDGSYRCRLFQKGAQKIVGFEFGASVTMEMTEKIVTANSEDQQRMISFKCVDSFFFTEFDGDWTAKERVSDMGEPETELIYVVDVRPKGPVPVAALEWRIREDVPTNLRAVKRAAMDVGVEGVMAARAYRSTIGLTSMSVAKSEESRRVEELLDQTNATRRTATSRSGLGKQIQEAKQPFDASRGSKAKMPTESVATGGKAKGNILQATGQKAQPSNQAIKRKQLPFKVNWEADETMAAYLTE